MSSWSFDVLAEDLNSSPYLGVKQFAHEQLSEKAPLWLWDSLQYIGQDDYS